MMAQHNCLRKDLLQFPEQGQQTAFLHQCACVGRIAVPVQSAFITDADAVRVVGLAMCAVAFQRPAPVDIAVTGDIEMITDVGEVAVEDVVGLAIEEGVVATRPGSTTVDND